MRGARWRLLGFRRDYEGSSSESRMMGWICRRRRMVLRTVNKIICWLLMVLYKNYSCLAGTRERTFHLSPAFVEQVFSISLAVILSETLESVILLKVVLNIINSKTIK